MSQPYSHPHSQSHSKHSQSSSYSQPQFPPQPQSQLTEIQLRDSLTKAVDQHNKTYSKSFSLHVRWEDDNTEGQRDSDNFKAFLAVFGFPPPSTLILDMKDVSPGWTLQAKAMSMFQEALNYAPQGRSVCFIHYAGHGTIGPNDELLFTSASGNKSINSNWLIDGCATDLMLPYDAAVDVIVILDCCYSYLATKGTQPVSRSVDILAAVDANAPGAFVPGQRVSFSAKLATKVAQLKGAGPQTIDMAELITILRAESPQRKPTHAVPLGVSSARLPFPGSAPGARPAGPPALRAVFSIKVDKNFSDQELCNLTAWLHSLSPNVGLTLDGVYKTNSTAFIFQGSYAIYSKLKGLPSVKLIFECYAPNRLPSVLADTPSGSPACEPSQGPSKDPQGSPSRGHRFGGSENIPFRY
ncbi:hypothetical protein Plec18167_002075 [Paecilomyces lecythidis]|uniref:Uncharacterized protein n=1 Tax=Paecilomyces lecythidis TaxID=3004212 RepID=A0ABR3Y850_9EURO